jgi:hypothetical protein
MLLRNIVSAAVSLVIPDFTYYIMLVVFSVSLLVSIAVILSRLTNEQNLLLNTVNQPHFEFHF